MADVDAAKGDLRRRMRRIRSDLDGAGAGGARRSDSLAERSRRIVDRLLSLDPFTGAALVVGYRSLPGEVDTTALERWCTANGVRYLAPAAAPDADVPAGITEADVLVVPGLAFDRSGRRLGQGGGWYDRVLAAGRPRLVVGLAFREQVVTEVPTEAHDLGVDCVVDDDGAWWAP